MTNLGDVPTNFINIPSGGEINNALPRMGVVDPKMFNVVPLEITHKLQIS